MADGGRGESSQAERGTPEEGDTDEGPEGLRVSARSYGKSTLSAYSSLKLVKAIAQNATHFVKRRETTFLPIGRG